MEECFTPDEIGLLEKGTNVLWRFGNSSSRHVRTYVVEEQPGRSSWTSVEKKKKIPADFFDHNHDVITAEPLTIIYPNHNHDVITAEPLTIIYPNHNHDVITAEPLIIIYPNHNHDVITAEPLTIIYPNHNHDVITAEPLIIIYLNHNHDVTDTLLFSSNLMRQPPI
jgi:hypothetical protein